MIEFDMPSGGAVGRRTFLKSAAIGLAGITLAQIGCRSSEVTGIGSPTDARNIRDLASDTESVQGILNVTTTVEEFGVTVLGAVLESIKQGNYDRPFPELVVAVLTAARAQEQFHLDFFQRAGGRALTSTFTVPPVLLTSYTTLFTALVQEEALEIATQLAAMRTYADLKRPDLVKVSFQYAAEEAEHRLLANFALGTRPANDVAFEPMLLPSVGAMIDSFKERGLIDGPFPRVQFPGPGTIDPTNVTHRTPEGPSA